MRRAHRNRQEEMTVKVSRRDRLLLTGLFGILAAVCSYFLVFCPVMEKAKALELENERLRAEITDLTIKTESKDSYVADTQSMKQDIDAVYQRFPVDVREEDGILLAVNQELIASMLIDSINISACEHVGPAEDYGEEAQHANVSEGSQSVPSSLMGRNVTMHYLVSYEGLKRSIKNIIAQDNRMSIHSLTVAYDESTGLLSGTTSVDMYCIPGQPGKEYIQPSFSSVLVGTDNIFGSLEAYESYDRTQTYGAGSMTREEEAAGTEEDTEEEAREERDTAGTEEGTALAEQEEEDTGIEAP